ncbi:MAG: TIGR02221 family CRISPR-associated protein, partial [Bacillota bacterium]
KHKEEIEEVIILGTDYSREKNWVSTDDGSSSLKDILEDMTQEEGINFNYKFKPIKNAKSEAEIWEFFHNVVEEIKEEEIIYFDVTHGFRYQPMMVMSVLNYVKVLKNAQIEKIFYGRYDGKENSEVIDMTTLDYLNDWVTAVDSFLTTGSSEKIADLSQKEIAKVMKATRGKDEFFRNLRGLVKSLKTFEDTLTSCRGKELNRAVNNVLSCLENLSQDDNLRNERMLPFVELIDKIKEKFDYFEAGEDKELKNYFHALQWCKDHNLLQQGLTILTENLITVITDEAGYDYYDIENREDVATALAYLNPERSLSKEECSYEDETVFETAVGVIEEQYAEIPKLYSEVSLNLRNDINHFGMRPYDSDSKKLKKELNNYINKVKQTLETKEEEIEL